MSETMDTTVVIAALGLAATLLGTWLGSYWQRRGARALQLLDARIRCYGECAASLYEYERATYDRVKSRLEGRPASARESLRDEAYKANAAARSALGQARVLSASRDVPEGLEAIRRAIGQYNSQESHTDLRAGHDAVLSDLGRVLAQARSDLEH